MTTKYLMPALIEQPEIGMKVIFMQCLSDGSIRYIRGVVTDLTDEDIWIGRWEHPFARRGGVIMDGTRPFNPLDHQDEVSFDDVEAGDTVDIFSRMPYGISMSWTATVLHRYTEFDTLFLEGAVMPLPFRRKDGKLYRPRA